MHKRKHSLKMFEGHDDLQAGITNQAFLFAQLTMQDAKANSLTREQIIKESTVNTERLIDKMTIKK